jgi:hypothetical protein
MLHPALTTARIQAFIPGESPPEVKTAMRFMIQVDCVLQITKKALWFSQGFFVSIVEKA